MVVLYMGEDHMSLGDGGMAKTPVLTWKGGEVYHSLGDSPSCMASELSRQSLVWNLLLQTPE